jgi:hypothetical protein
VGGSYLPSFLRCTRVRRSSLRCFFFDIRLRRFLITEPITPLSVLDCPTPPWPGTCNNPHTLPKAAYRTPKAPSVHPGRRHAETRRPERTLDAASANSMRSALASVEVGALQHVVHGLGVHPEGSPHSDCRQFTVVNQPVDRHLADAHQCCHFGHSQELRPGRLAVYGTSITSRFTASRIPRRWPVH